MAPQQFTRSERKQGARKAVVAVLEKYPSSEFTSSTDFDDILDRIVALAQECKLVGFAIDETDVSRALRYLHHEGVLTVSHGKEEADYIHRVYLRR